MRVKPLRRRIIVEVRTGFVRFREAVLLVAVSKPLRSISRERSVFFVMRMPFFFLEGAELDAAIFRGERRELSRDRVAPLSAFPAAIFSPCGPKRSAPGFCPGR